MKFNLNGGFFKPQPCDEPEFDRMLQDQADHVDREILVQQLLIAYGKDVRNLESFIGDDVRKALHYDDSDWEFLWEFCDEFALAVQEGYPVGKKKKYLGFQHTGLFTGVVFVPKSKKATMEQILDWASTMNYTDI